MEAVISRDELDSLPDVVSEIQNYDAQEVKRLTALCLAVFAYEKRYIFQGDPTKDELQQFVRALKDLQERVRQRQKVLGVKDLEWLVDRIQFSLDSHENPMTKEEADALLDKYFPDER